jgi:hypothetical protein
MTLLTVLAAAAPHLQPEVFAEVAKWQACFSAQTCSTDMKSSVWLNDSVMLFLRVKSPSGIIVERVPDATDQLMATRICSLQHSAVSVRQRWAQVFTLPVFTPEESNTLMRRAEERGKLVGGWGRSHNPLDDLPSKDLSALEVLGETDFRDLKNYLQRSLLHAMAESFGLDLKLLWLRYYFLNMSKVFENCFLQRSAFCQV